MNGGIFARGMARAYERGRQRVLEINRERAAAKKAKLPKGICGCGGFKRPGHIVCLDCYTALPQSLRDAYQRLSTRREATRRMIDFSCARKCPPTVSETGASTGQEAASNINGAAAPSAPSLSTEADR